MPTVQRSDVLHVVRELWGFKGAPVDDQAKLALAEALIKEAWEHNNKWVGPKLLTTSAVPSCGPSNTLQCVPHQHTHLCRPMPQSHHDQRRPANPADTRACMCRRLTPLRCLLAVSHPAASGRASKSTMQAVSSRQRWATSGLAHKSDSPKVRCGA